MNDYESYRHSLLYDSEPSEDELEDDGSAASERERAELEEALYSQLHFEHDAGLELTDHNVSGVFIEEEVLGPPPEQHDLNWRERLLGELGLVDRKGTASDCVQEVVNSKGKGGDKQLNANSTKKMCTLISTDTPKKEAKGDKGNTPKKKAKVEQNQGTNRAEKLTRKRVAEKYDNVKCVHLVKKSKQKGNIKKQESSLSKLLYQNEMGNKVAALDFKKKNALNKVKTQKTRPLRVFAEHSDDSSLDPPVRKKRKAVNLTDMVVVDSISGSDLESGNSEDPIACLDLSDGDLSDTKSEVYATDGDSDIDEVNSEGSSPSVESSDESVTMLDADIGLGDIQTNLTGCVVTPHHHPREPLATHAPTPVPLDSLNLEDYKDLSLEDIHVSMGECDWELVMADKYSGAKSTVNRYFKELNVTCHNCKEKGHLSKICPKPRRVPVCLHCGIEGHMTRGCPRPVCFNCFRLGHRREDCTDRRWRLSDWCKRCGMQGHTKGNCSDLWRQYHMTTKEGPLNEVKIEKNPRVFCYNCAKKGHWGHECKEERMDYYTAAQLPFIAKYELPCQAKAERQDPSSQGRSKKGTAGGQRANRTRKDNARKAAKDESRGPPAKKRKTQNEKFEAEYQSMVRKVDENWKKGQNKRSRKNNYLTKTSFEAKHSGDFPRSARGGGQRHEGHSQGQRYSQNSEEPRGSSNLNKYKGRGKRRRDDRPAPETQRDYLAGRDARSDHQWKRHGNQRSNQRSNQHNNQHSNQRSNQHSTRGRGQHNQKQKKKQFTSHRGFHSYF